MKSSVISFFSQNQILTALLVVGIGWLIFSIKEVLIALFVSYILMAALSPSVDFLRKNKVPKPIAVIIPYILAVGTLSLIVVMLLPFFINQVQLLLTRLAVYINQDLSFFGAKIDPTQINSFAASEIENIGKNAISLITKIFGGVFSVVSIFAISFYLLLYKQTVTRNFVSLFPKNHQEKVNKIIMQIEEKLGNWLRGQIVLSVSIGVTTWVVLTLLGVDFALPLAVI